MENEKDKIEVAEEIDGIIAKIDDEIEQEKEEKLLNLIIEIVVSSTLKQYYETSNQILTIQPAGPK